MSIVRESAEASLCVFCGSSLGVNPSIAKVARELGTKLAQQKIELVYGGGHVGIMGVIADAVLAQQGRVKGVIPKSIVELEVAHSGLTELIIVDTMHERKHIMYEAADAFLIFPGGIGTLDEFFEIWTWKQLRYHSKPIFIYNHEGFFDHLLKHLEVTVEAGFFSANDFALLKSYQNLEDLWAHLSPLLLGRDPST